MVNLSHKIGFCTGFQIETDDGGLNYLSFDTNSHSVFSGRALRCAYLGEDVFYSPNIFEFLDQVDTQNTKGGNRSKLDYF